MSAHQCPYCPLLFGVKTELEFHLREEHPSFRHDYPEHRHPDHRHPDHRPPEHRHAVGTGQPAEARRPVTG